jgi:hypothetical protein
LPGATARGVGMTSASISFESVLPAAGVAEGAATSTRTSIVSRRPSGQVSFTRAGENGPGGCAGGMMSMISNARSRWPAVTIISPSASWSRRTALAGSMR